MFSPAATRAFRRLSGKTQVIYAPRHDHVGTRLTHTLEVASIARQLARGIGERLGPLDHDLVEAIALAHDVGHPPFGHAGESVLSHLAADAGLGGFHHASFGVRLLSELETHSHTDEAPSADLLDGVLAHSKGRHGAVFARGPALQRRRTEALIVRAADLYAYASGDLDDAQRLGIFQSSSALPAVVRKLLGCDGAAVRRVLVQRTVEAVAAEPALGVHLDPEGDRALGELRAFLYERFYEGPPTADQTHFAREVLTRLWQRFRRDIEGTLNQIGWARRESNEPSLRDALDAVACMTDRFAVAAAG